MSEDLECTYWIYRQHPEYVKGKLVSKGGGRMDSALSSMEKEQKLHADVMHVDGKMFLVTVVTH